MKKGFTMIELIFVIVILGILASVAIPRLAGTRDDAEISAAIGNLRTLVSDASAFYVAKGTFDGAKLIDFTNVPLKKTTGGAIDNTVDATAAATLAIGGVDDCITIQLTGRAGNTPAYIKFTKKANATGVCQTVVGKDPVKSFIESTVNGVTLNGATGAMAIGSSIKVY